jgi:hypothetical protein
MRIDRVNFDWAFARGAVWLHLITAMQPQHKQTLWKGGEPFRDVQ